MATDAQHLLDLPLGKNTKYEIFYNPKLLQSIPRQINRNQLAIVDSQLPFHGKDIWTLYELSWLNANGMPQVAVAQVEIPVISPNLIESKSFKLYLNSFNQHKINSWSELQSTLVEDLSKSCGAQVQLRLYTLDEFAELGIQKFIGSCIDVQDVALDNYQYSAKSLINATGGNIVTETLFSHLLKSNCLVTNQPDWGSILISYTGAQIKRLNLLQYIISFRQHNEFHEQCVERIFVDLMRYCKPDKLTVYARYTRRGGIDINPWRSNQQFSINAQPMARQ